MLRPHLDNFGKKWQKRQNAGCYSDGSTRPMRTCASLNRPEENEMSTNRLFVVVIAIALAALAALTFREGLASRAVASSTDQASMDSATRSYTGWAQAVELTRIDSATRSYAGWAKVLTCDGPLNVDQGIDSATRSYIGMARAAECGALP
jgi:hypothetical protein